MKPRTLALATLSLLLVAPLPLIEADSPSHPPDPDVQAAFDDLQAYIQGVEGLTRGERNSFLSKVNAAEAKYDAGQVCTAHNVLGAFLDHAQGQRANPVRTSVAEDLYNRGHRLRTSFFDVFVDNPDLVPPSPCFDPDATDPPEPNIVASDNTQFAATLTFPDPAFNTVLAGGETWTQIGMPGLETLIGEPGLPSVPFWRALLAVPQGATAELMVEPPEPDVPVGLNLFPFQESPVDQEGGERTTFDDVFADPPFVKDPVAYATNAPYPSDPCVLNPVGQYRDVQMVQILCAAGQYNTVTDELLLFDSLSFEVNFIGGPGNFITSQTLSPFEKASTEVLSSSLNAAVLGAYVEFLDLSDLICFGEELLVLTHPNFRAAADDLATWKEQKGIETTVIDVGGGTPYATGDAIQDLIHERYDDCLVRPSYVLLVGDSEWVPPADTYDISDDSSTGSDWGYASYVQVLFDAFFPDFAVGRIPVDTLAEAQTVVDKTIAYESSPPFLGFGAGAPFYTTASFASQFQCCRMTQNGNPLNSQPGTDQRAFVETSEVARNRLVAAGKTVERIYGRTTDDGGYCLVETPPACPSNQVQMPYNGDATPRRYYGGALLPAALGAGSGFPWNGDAGDVVDAFNDGRFLVLHRDHGGPSGWGTPGFNTGHIPSLTNGDQLPVLYSVNCKSGYWDRETDGEGSSESFMEQMLLKSGGGMVAGLGDNRNSPTWANNALTRGFFDATWTSLAPEYGGATPVTRLGDVLNHGKVYMLTQVGAPQYAGSVSLTQATDEYIMWHAFGDPTLEMWTANPHQFVLPLGFELSQVEFDFTVEYTVEGAELTAFVLNGEAFEAYGRGTVVGGRGEIRGFNPQPDPPGVESLMLVATFPNAVPAMLKAPVRPERLPDLVVRSLTLEGGMVVTQGEDLTSRLGLVVANIDAGPGAGTVMADGSVSPDPGHMVDLVLSRDAFAPEGFATVPPPEGEAFEEDGLLLGGRLSRTLTVPGFDEIAYPIGEPVFADLGGVIPEQAPPTRMFLCARVDPGAAVAESNEANNLLCVEVDVLAPAPPPPG